MKTLLVALLLSVASFAVAADPSKSEERRMADLALGKYKQSVLAARRVYEKSIADAQAELGNDYDKAINGAMKHGAAGLELANQLLAERKSKLEDETSADDVVGPTFGQVIKMLDGKQFREGWEPGVFGDTFATAVKHGKVAATGRGEWSIEKRWVLKGPAHISIPNPNGSGEFRGFHIPTGRQEFWAPVGK